jgi:hypothetical protein
VVVQCSINDRRTLTGEFTLVNVIETGLHPARLFGDGKCH